MKRVVLVSILVVCTTCPTEAWWPGGHDIITVAAVKATPEVPSFFKGGAGFIAHMSYDPDLAKNRGTPLARGAEHSEHYLDVELLKGRELPAKRYEFIQLCQDLGDKPEGIGLVPYAVSEWTERLAVAFAEYRKWPENPHIQAKCQVYAGILSHYAQDMCQPLHLTVDFNGRKDTSGNVQQKGIHEKVDALPESLEMDAATLAAGHVIEPVDSLMTDVVAQLYRGFELVDRVYELGPRMLKYGQKDWERDEEVVSFALERVRESVRFTASLYLTAWRRSASLKLPGWLDRSEDTQTQE